MTSELMDKAVDRRIYDDGFADYLKARCVGHPYRPSNGMEGEMFDRSWCADCQRDAAFRADPDNADGCPIYANAFAFGTNDPGYPKEWVIGDNGQPKCTAHEPVTTTT